MIQNRSYFDNTASPDNTFNFGNELDISNGKKDKTGEMFFKQAYDFDDFQNIGDDKTIKSSNYKTRNNNMSNILKRQEQLSNKIIGNSVLGEFQLSGTGFHTKKVLDQSINKALSQTQKFPQFGQRKLSVESNKKYAQYSNSKQASAQGIKINMRGSQLSYSKSNIEAQDPLTLQNTMSKMGFGIQDEMRVKYEDYPESFRKKDVHDFKKKEMSNFKQEHLLTKEQEYKQLMSRMNFFKSEAERISYQRTVMQQESIGEMMNLCNSQGLQEQLKNHLEQINQLNREIQQQRAAQKKLTRVIAELQQEYNQIIDSVEQMDFQRPPIIKDEAKVLMDEINQLKKQFRDLQIDNGELNLSCTIPQVGTLQSIENRMGQSHHHKQTIHHQQQQMQNYLNTLFEEIHQENSHCQDPQFLKNLKLACLKDQWTIFTNKEIIVSLDYKTCPLIKMRIGNKTNQELQKFTMHIQVQNFTVNYMQNQTINKKAFLLQGIKVDPQNLADLFIRINLSYQISQTTPQTKSIRLYCPTGILNFGEFTPLTIKQFETQMALPLPTLQSSLKPMDKSFMNSIQQVMLYIPNLKSWPGQNDKLFGLFMSVFNQGTLVLIEQNLDLIKIKLKNGNKPLLKLLEFILTV